MKKKSKIKIPDIFQCLFDPMRHKIFYGGRGGAKSWNIAIVLLIRGAKDKLRILCVREIQGSIKDSVHKLLCDMIVKLDYQDFYKVTESQILGKNGTEFIFKGLLRNITEVKSTEGVDICWVEEAENVSSESWKTLTPTIRAESIRTEEERENVEGYDNFLEKSEIWVSFNPKRKNSATYKKWVVNKPPNTLGVSVNYWDNPYFPSVLRDEMEYDKKHDYRFWQQNWCGLPMGVGGRIYPKFDRKIHVREFDRDHMIKKANFYMAIDPHSKYYPAIIFIAIFPKNERKKWPEDFHKHVYAEFPTTKDMDGPYHELRHKIRYEGTLSQMATNIYAREGHGEGIKIIKRFVDTRYAKGAGGRTMTTVGLVEEWAKENNGSIRLEMPAEKLIDIQRELIQEDLDFNKHAPISEFNEPPLTISNNCPNLITSLENHCLQEDSEKEDEEFKDFSDGLRILYAGLTDFKYKEPEAEKTDNYYFPVHRGGWMG